MILPNLNINPNDLLAYAGGLFSDLWALIVIIIGIPFGFWLIETIKSYFPKDLEDIKRERRAKIIHYEKD